MKSNHIQLNPWIIQNQKVLQSLYLCGLQGIKSKNPRISDIALEQEEKLVRLGVWARRGIYNAKGMIFNIFVCSVVI